MTADLRLPIVNYFPFNLAFNLFDISIVCIWKWPAQKKNNGCKFTIDLSDDDDYFDLGYDEEIDHNLSQADLLDRDDRRREERQRREREEREARRSQTLENSVSNSGDLKLSGCVPMAAQFPALFLIS
jgi:hypothetical protein